MDSLIRHCSEEIALDGSSGCSIDRLWEFAANFFFRQGIVQNLDDNYKTFVWPLILKEDGIEVWIEDEDATGLRSKMQEIPWNYQDITIELRARIRLFASEDRQWLTLTYKTKTDSKIQPLAFELLSCISRYRQEGVDRIQLCKETKQEPRSVYGRIQALEDASLISKVAINRSRAQTALLVLKRFESENSTINETVAQVSGKQIYNTEKIRSNICDAVQSSRNGICRHVDARAMVNLNHSRWERRYYARQVTYLHNNGYLRKCLTFVPNSPDRCIRCLQFIKPYISSLDATEDDVDFTEVDDIPEDDELEEEEPLLPSKEEFDASFLQPLADVGPTLPQWSRFRPLEFQCFVLIRNAGFHGVITLQILSGLTGIRFNKPLFKLLGSLVEHRSSVPNHLSHMSITRFEDKTKKSRQYRYFTLQSQLNRLIRDGIPAETISKLLPHVHSLAGEFSPIDSSLFLNSLHHKGNMESNAEVSPDGMTLLPRKRGRPRKSANISVTSSPIRPSKNENNLPSLAISPVSEGFIQNATISTPSTSSNLSIAGSLTPSKTSRIYRGLAPLKNPEFNEDHVKKAEHLEPLLNVSSSVPSKNFTVSSPDHLKYGNTSSLQVSDSQSSIDLDSSFHYPVSVDSQLSHSTGSLMANFSSPTKKRRLESVDFIFLQRKGLILSYLVEQNGAFEISRKMFEDLADLKVRRNPETSRTVMDRRTFQQTLEKLMQEKKVRKLVIATNNGLGKLVRKDIVVQYDMKPDSPRFQQLRAQITTPEIEKQSTPEILKDVDVDFLKRNTSLSRRKSMPAEIKRHKESSETKPVDKEEVKKNEKEKDDPMRLAQQLLESLAPDFALHENTQQNSPVEKPKKLRKDRYASVEEFDYFSSTEHSSKRSVKRFKNDFSSDEDETLIRAVVITQIYYGGTNRLIKWEAVQKCFPNRDIYALTRRYLSIRQHTKFKGLQQFLSENWQQMYKDAVSRKDLMPYPDSVDDFDPTPYVKASCRPYMISSSNLATTRLPRDLVDVYETYNIEVVKQETNFREMIFDPSLSVASKMNAYCDMPFTMPLSLNDKQNNEGDENCEKGQLFDAKSTIKSIVAIPDATYDARFSQERLMQYPEDILIAAHQELLDKKIITRVNSENSRLQPGRNFQFTEKFASSLKSPLPPFLLSQAKRFNKFLLEGFQNHKNHLFEETSNSGTLACILDLLSQGKLQISIVGSKFNEYGLSEGYRTRLLEHDNINVTLVLSGKESESKKNYGVTEKLATPPSHEPRLWLNGKCELIEMIWMNIEQSIVYQLLRKPGILRSQLTNLLFPGLEPREFNEVLDYFIAAGAAIEKDGLYLNHNYLFKLT